MSKLIAKYPESKNFIHVPAWVNVNTLLYVLPLILLIPALFINLGLLPAFGDESIRALVALEFIYKDDYITPTLNGELYYNKPPLFNWILLMVFQYAGQASEFFIRLPAVVSLLLFSLTIYLTSFRYIGKKMAFISAFSFITFGRMLFYDAMLGHIDILFSLIVYLALFSFWHYKNKSKDYLMFICPYLLTAVAFLMKGFPAIVFLGMTFAGFIIYDRKFGKFISWAHFLGLSLFFVTIGCYFYLYSLKNDPAGFVKTLWDQSTQRTAMENKWEKSLQFFFTFPFAYIFHLAPWSVLLITFFRKDFKTIIKNNPFVLFSVIVICSNILVYWFSPKTLPRYVFPIIPFMLITLIYSYFNSSKTKVGKLADILITIAFFTFTLASLLPFIVDMPIYIPFRSLKTILFFLIFIILTFLSLNLKSHRLILLISLLLVARIEFDHFVLPVRSVEFEEVSDRESVMKAISSIDPELPVYINKDIRMKNCVSYYFTREQKRLIKYEHEPVNSDAYCIIEDHQFNPVQYETCTDFVTDKHHYLIVKRRAQ